MNLDSPTLVLLTATVAFGLGVLSLLFSYLQTGTRGMRHWGAGMMGLGAGYLLVFLYPRTADLVVLFSGWSFMIVSLLIMYRALMRTCGDELVRGVWGYAVAALTVLGWVYFGYVQPSALGRTNITSAAVSVIAARAAWNVWRFARRTRFNAPAVVVAVILLLIAASPLLEILLRKAGSEASAVPIEYGPVSVVFARVIIIAALTMSVMWLEIYRLNKILEDLALRDELTGISNRRAIIADCERELARATRQGTDCSVAIFDVDFFKRINDSYGHPVGDEALRWLVKILKRSVRTYDLLGRFGGEEFLLVMPNVPASGAAAIAERARAAIESEACIVEGRTIRVTVSAGIASTTGATALVELLAAADRALYRAKESGRNRVQVAVATGDDPV